MLAALLKNYPSLSLKSFYSPFLHGGVTYKQMEKLFSLLQKQKDEEYRIIGAFHGISFSDEKTVPKDQLPGFVKSPDLFVFGDPAAYEKMDQNERQALTEQMMGNHKQWQSSGGLGGKK